METNLRVLIPGADAVKATLRKLFIHGGCGRINN
jgi:hypothetical protein